MVEFFNLIVEKVDAQGMFSGEHFCADGIAVSGEALLDKNLRWHLYATQRVKNILRSSSLCRSCLPKIWIYATLKA